MGHPPHCSAESAQDQVLVRDGAGVANGVPQIHPQWLAAMLRFAPARRLWMAWLWDDQAPTPPEARARLFITCDAHKREPTPDELALLLAVVARGEHAAVSFTTRADADAFAARVAREVVEGPAHE